MLASQKTVKFFILFLFSLSLFPSLGNASNDSNDSEILRDSYVEEDVLATLLLRENPNLGLGIANQKDLLNTLERLRSRLLSEHSPHLEGQPIIYVQPPLYVRNNSKEGGHIYLSDLNKFLVIFKSKQASQGLLDWLGALRKWREQPISYRETRETKESAPRLANFLDEKLSKTQKASISCRLALDAHGRRALTSSTVLGGIGLGLKAMWWFFSQFPNSGGCFTAGTSIALSAGNKPIEKLKVGEKVIS